MFKPAYKTNKLFIYEIEDRNCQWQYLALPSTYEPGWATIWLRQFNLFDEGVNGKLLFDGSSYALTPQTQFSEYQIVNGKIDISTRKFIKVYDEKLLTQLLKIHG